jgi:hypothetical protein
MAKRHSVNALDCCLRLCYHRAVGRSGTRLALLSLMLLSCGHPAWAADDRDLLTLARLLYNQRQYEAAITAAEQGRQVPARADSADLIAARAYLERFREDSAPDNLVSARERLRRLDPQRLVPRERVEFVVGLGEALFLDGSFGAASDLFDSILAGSGELPPASREQVLDWWATAVDRGVRLRPDIERQGPYQQIRQRMQQELTARPGSRAAADWAAAAARGQGDLDAAWNAAQAGWVRAPLADDRGVALRADLDRLVSVAIVPERARVLAQPPDALRLEWEQFKQRWTKNDGSPR